MTSVGTGNRNWPRLPQTAVFICVSLTWHGLVQGAAAQPVRTPDWPCAQLLVPVLTAGSYWAGEVPAHSAWRDDDHLFALVTDIVDRDTPDDDAQHKLAAYASGLNPAQRAALFGALVDQTNDERTLLIHRIEQLGLRQRRMGDVVAAISTKVDDTPPDDPHRADLAGERDFDVRAFQETQRTMRYVCEAPGAMERRLGMFARVLRASGPEATQGSR